MTPDQVKKYLKMAALFVHYNVDANGVDSVPCHVIRNILRGLILRGDCVKCALCGRPIETEQELSLDHTVPYSQGGSNYLHNMQPAHRECNVRKSNTMTQADIDAACAGACDCAAEILARKKKRKSFGQKNRHVTRIKPWELMYDKEYS